MSTTAPPAAHVSGARLVLTSALAAPADVVWAHASTMAGVNAELRPWVTMTVPPAVRGRSLADVPLGEEAFTSTLLALGVVPFDRHHLTLIALEERGFVEESWSWLQRRWRHERRVVPSGAGCTVTDTLVIVPRVAPAWLVTPVVRRIFTARHARLRALFGTISC